MLTGKCKEDFNKWVDSIDRVIVNNVGDSSMCMTFPYNFEQLSLPMQMGVYIDFFESNGYRAIYIYHHVKKCVVHTRSSKLVLYFNVEDDINSRRKEVLKSANEIYNAR